MFFIVVYWQTNRWGYTTRKDFEAAVYELDFQHVHGYAAELWMWDRTRWMRIDFVGNMKHKPYSAEIG